MKKDLVILGYLKLKEEEDGVEEQQLIQLIQLMKNQN